MIRAVFDTNIIVSGLFWGSLPRKAIDVAGTGQFSLITSEALINELEDVLSRQKFVEELAHIGETVQTFLDNDYRLLAQVVEAPRIYPVVKNDPDDDAVVACAVAGQADFIISGDRHLLSLGEYQGIKIWTVAHFLNEALNLS